LLNWTLILLQLFSLDIGLSYILYTFSIRSQIIIPRVGGGSSLPPSPSLSVQHDKTKKIDIYVKAPTDSADDKTDCNYYYFTHFLKDFIFIKIHQSLNIVFCIFRYILPKGTFNSSGKGGSLRNHFYRFGQQDWMVIILNINFEVLV
jgi:hypothetical protein